MRQILGVLSVLGSALLVACGSDPPPPPPAPVSPQQPSNLLTVAAEARVENIDPAFLPPDGVAQPRNERATFTARVVPGMERVDAIAITEVGLCALADGKAPICVDRSDPPGFVAAPSEVLRKWLAADGIECRLSPQSKLTCFGGSAPFSATGVRDFVLAQNKLLYTLSTSGAVTITLLAQSFEPRTSVGVFRNAVALQELGGEGACVRSTTGEVTCTSEAAAFGVPPAQIRGAVRATHLAPGFFRDDAGTLFTFGRKAVGPAGDPNAALRLGDGIVELATIGAPAREVCVTLTSGNARCRPTARGEAEERKPSDVTLPRGVKRFHPAAAPCVELQNGTVACWGADLERLARLGLRVLELSPGAIAPG